MKRGSLAVAGAAAGVVGVVVLHSSSPSSPFVAASGISATTTTAPSSTTTGAGKAGGATAGVGKVGATTTTTLPSPSGPRSATGAVEQYGYGQLAVNVTVLGTRIETVNVVGLQTAESYSQQLAAQVLPMLHSEVLSAQSTRVNGISGATYTTEAYLYSLQSALDKLHVK